MNIIGPSTVSVEAAQAWARNRNAHERFAAVAPLYWQIAPRYGIPPEIAYTQAGHETALGKYTGVVPSTYNNWCGLKTKQGGSNTSASAHQQFPDAATGVLAHIQHLARYAGLQTLPAGDALVDPRWSVVSKFTTTVEGLGGAWAPAATYGQGIVALTENLRAFANDGGWNMPTLTPPSGWKPPEIVRRILPRNASNTPQRRMDWQYITVHNTGNPNPTANALMHASYLEGLAKQGASEPSWQYTVDDTRVVQHLEDDQAGWHASDGDGDGNLASLGFELVEIGDQERVLWNAGYVMAQKLKSKGKDIDWMRQHHDWARDKKNCPRLLRANNGAGWKRLLAIVDHFLDDTPAPSPADDRILVVGNPLGPYGYALGFKGRLQQIGAAISPTNIDLGILAWSGWPMEDEWQGEDGCSYQRTERLILKWSPVDAPFDITPMLRSGVVLPKRKGS